MTQVSDFLYQLRRDYPDLSHEDMALLSGHWKLYRIPQARQLLTLQGLPWAFKRAKRWHEYDLTMAVDIAIEASINCADKFNPSKGKLTTLISFDVDNKEKRRYRMASKQPMQQLDDVPDHRDRGHRHDLEVEVNRQHLHRMMLQFSERTRKILLLHLDGMKFRDIAKQIGVSRSSVGRSSVGQVIKRATQIMRAMAESV